MSVKILWLLCSLVLSAALASTANAEKATIISLGGQWQISPIQKSSKPVDLDQETAKGLWKIKADTSGWQSIQIPTMAGFNSVAPDDVFPSDPSKVYWFANFRTPTFNWAWYRHRFDTPAIAEGSRVFIHFMAVAWESHLWINGQKIGMHRGAFTGFEYDITDALNPSGANTISLLAVTDYGLRPMQRVYGKMFFPRANMAGVIGPVELRVRPAVYVQRMEIMPDLKRSVVTANLWISNTSGAEKTFELSAKITQSNNTATVAGNLNKPLTLRAPAGKSMQRIEISASGWKTWSPDQPALYDLTVSLARQGQATGEFTEQFGFRSFEIQNGQFFLNGERIRLYYGNILTLGNFVFYDSESAAKFRQWLRRQKAQGVNAIRYHMGGVDSYLMLGICDEEGMLVIDEWPWFHRVESAIKNPAALETFYNNNDYEMQAWIERDFNHPSNIIWSLSNEVWTPGEVPMLDHTYQQMRKLDPTSRPMSNTSGFHSVLRDRPALTDIFDFHNYSMHNEYPWSLMHESIQLDFDALTRIYGKVEKPVIVSESLNITRNQIKDKNPITPDSYVESAGFYGVREVGMAAMKDASRNTNYMVDTFGVRTLEKFRQDTRIQGFSPWFEASRNRLPDGIASVYGPYYVGYREFACHITAKKNWQTDVTIIKDPLGEQKAQLRIAVVGRGGAQLFTSQQNVVLPENQDETTARIVLGELPAGKAKLVLELWQGDKKLAQRADDILVMDGPPALSAASGKKVAIYQPAGQKCTVRAILKEQGIPVRALKTLDSLDDIDTLIIGNGWDDSLAPSGPAIQKWIEQGGRLIAFEARKSAGIPWAGGYETVQGSKIRQPFVDLISPAHPIFAGLEADNFDRWNGNHSILSDTLITPLTPNAIAAAGTYGNQGPMAAILEASLGKGSFIMTQLNAVERYESDPVAARYIHNVLQYALTPSRQTVRELMRPSRGKLLELTQGIPQQKIFSVDLRKSVNAPLKDTFGSSSQLDLRHLPTGRQTFRSIPFDIINPAANQNRSILVMQGNRTPEMPKRVTDIAVNQYVQTLFFLHTAYYATPNTMARYIVEYEDRTRVEIVVDGGVIGDWFAPRDRADALVAWSDNHPIVTAANIGLYLFPWSNPHPEKKISTLEVLAEGSEQHAGGSVTLVAISGRLAR